MTDQETPVALVTGGGSGIGRACALRLARSGYTVVIADQDPARSRSTIDELGGGHLALVVDVTDEEDVTKMTEATLGRLGRLDVAVNSAGILGPRLRTHETTKAQWRTVMDVNLDGVFLAMRSELEAMRLTGGGAIVNVASIMGVVGTPNAAAYVASKHAVVGLTKAAAWEYAGDGIRVNVVGPGYTETPLLQDHVAERGGEIGARHAFGRLAHPDEIASVVEFLASPAAAFVTGAFVPVDGGFTAR